MRDLVKTTAAIGVTEVLLMGVSLIRNKFLAVTIGPEGFGIFALLNSFFLMISAFAGTWMTVGATKYVAEYQGVGDRRATERVFTASIGITGIISIIIGSILLIQKKWVLTWLLAGSVKEEYFLIFLISFLAMNIRPLLLGILQGMLRVREVVLGRWCIAGVDLLLVITLVFLYGLSGFFYSILISSFFAVCVFAWGIVRNNGLCFRKIDITDTIIKSFLLFGFINLFLSLINSGSQYLQRTIVLENLDLSAVGLFQAGVALKGYLGVFSRGAVFYYLPQMSSNMENADRRNKINEFLRLILLLSIPSCVVAILFGKWIIILLYSSAFQPLTYAFYWFVLAQFFGNFGTALQIPLVGTARLKIHTVSSIAVHSMWVIIPFVFVKKYGLSALGLGFLAGALIGPLINGYYLRRAIDFKPSFAVVKVFGLGFSVLTGAVLLRNSSWHWQVVWVLLTGLFLCLELKRAEWEKGYDYILVKLRSKKDSVKSRCMLYFNRQ